MRWLVGIAAILFTVTAARAADVSRPTDAELPQRLHLPQGFEIRVFASGLSGARFMTLGPDGMIYVSMPSAGSVGRLRMAGDGTVARVERVIQGLDRPHGLTFHDGKL